MRRLWHWHRWTDWELGTLRSWENAREWRCCKTCPARQWRYLRLGHEF